MESNDIEKCDINGITVVLGADDPEMRFVGQSCRSMGLRVVQATSGGVPVVPATANAADALAADVLAASGNVVWIECRPKEPLVIEGARQHFIDHHGADAPRATTIAEAFRASSVGQLLALLIGLADEMYAFFPHESTLLGIAAGRLGTAEAVAVGAMDHDLRAIGWHGEVRAPRGACIASDDGRGGAIRLSESDMVDYRIMSRAAFEGRPIGEMVTAWRKESIALASAKKYECTYSPGTKALVYVIGDIGTFTAELFALRGAAYLANPRLRPGEMGKVQLGGDVSYDFICAWMAAMRYALADESVEGRDERAKARLQTADRTGVYGSPARGFAGAYGYTPESCLRAMAGSDHGSLSFLIREVK